MNDDNGFLFFLLTCQLIFWSSCFWTISWSFLHLGLDCREPWWQQLYFILLMTSSALFFQYSTSAISRRDAAFESDCWSRKNWVSDLWFCYFYWFQEQVKTWCYDNYFCCCYVLMEFSIYLVTFLDDWLDLHFPFL